MVALVKHVGKEKVSETPAVPEVVAGSCSSGCTLQQVVEKIRKGIRGQRYQAMAKFRLFKEMQQDSKTFAEWWPEVLEQAERCNWSMYSSEMAERDAILYQTRTRN